MRIGRGKNVESKRVKWGQEQERIQKGIGKNEIKREKEWG